jgi:hypothetical protein
MVEFINGTLYSCDCGYNTLYSKHACQHTKTKKCSGKVMKKEDLRFVKEEDYDMAIGKNHTTGDTVQRDKIIDNSIDNSTVNITDNSITNVTLVLPERTTKEDFVEYLESLGQLGFRTPEQVATMPGKMLMFTRDAKKLPGALIERDKKIIEKLPDGTERVMGKKKAIQTYTHEAVDALCLRPPAIGVSDFLEVERGSKRTKMSLQDAVKLRVKDPKNYHNSVPEDVKHRHQRIESHTEKALDKITTENKTNGYL